MRRQLRRRSPRLKGGFTLVEILVVLAIFLIVTIMAVPAIMSGLQGRQVTDGARIFTGALAGIRDAAIRQNQPQGIRLMPDPLLTIPAPGQPGAGTIQLAYNRMVSIEPAGDHSEGHVSIGPVPGTRATAGFPPAYPIQPGFPYPFPDSTTLTTNVLMIEEAPFAGGFLNSNPPPNETLVIPNSPTNWYWNVRVGDKIKIGATGRAYTIVGPCTISPWGSGPTEGNPELFVNVGPPGTTSPLTRTIYAPGTPLPTPIRDYNPEFLFLVDGEDDDDDGWIDEGWDGANNNPYMPAHGAIPNPPFGTIPPYTPLPTDNLVTDELFEWEAEKWVGAQSANVLVDGGSGSRSPTPEWVAGSFSSGTHDVPYLIQRRPVPTQGARETMLPVGVVIDATTCSSLAGSGGTDERSRVPITPGSLYVDIMVNPNGSYIPNTIYSTPSGAGTQPFIHFWITDRNDVHPRGSVWGTDASGPIANSTAGQTYQLPMASDAIGGYPPAGKPLAPVLKNDRRLVTFFPRNGLVTTNTIETIPSPNALLPGEGFNVGDVNYPFYKAQLGQREAR
jgi:prepilin-type N-terminal cleavage/methylation domain-containing protein